MTARNFRRIALSLEGVEEFSHAGLPAFRIGGRKFASLASQAAGYGNLVLTLEQQAAFVEEAPEIFLPIPGGWGGWDKRIFACRRARTFWWALCEWRGCWASIITQSRAGKKTLRLNAAE